MQAIVKSGVVQKIRLTAVESRRLEESEGILLTLSRLCPEAVPEWFVSQYGTVIAEVKKYAGPVRAEVQGVEQLTFLESPVMAEAEQEARLEICSRADGEQ